MSSRLLGHVWSLDLPDPTVKLVLLRLADNANDDTGECFPSMQYLQDKCSIKSKNTVRRALSVLEELGLIVVVHRKTDDKQNKSNLYRLNISKIINPIGNKVGSNSEGGRSNSEGGGRSNSEGGGRSNSAPITNNSFEPINELNNTLQPQAVATSPKRKYIFSEVDLRLAKEIFAKIKRLNPKHKEPNLDSWANDVRLISEVDGKNYAEISELFEWANQDSFWQANILSPRKLREKWDILTLQKSRKKPQRGDNMRAEWNTPEAWAEVL